MPPRRRMPVENPVSYYDVKLIWVPNLPGLAQHEVWGRIRGLDLRGLYTLQGIEFFIDGVSPIMRITYVVNSGTEAQPTFAELAGEAIRQAAREVMPTLVRE